MRPKRPFLFFVLLTLGVCTLSLYIYRHRQGKTGAVDNLLIGFTGGVQQQSFYFVRGIRSLVDRYFLLVHSANENVRLEAENTYLRTKIAALSEVEAENQRLANLLHFRQQMDPPLLASHVIGHDVSSEHFGIRIDRGSNDGIEIGMGVISPAGLVGRVFRTTPTISDVLTLVDPASNIDVIVQRSRSRGILSGQGDPRTCRLGYLDRLEDVKVNDTVVASGFGQIFPKGLLVGYVDSVVADPSGVLLSVRVRSAVDIYRLEEVFVVAPTERTKKAS